MIYNMVIPWWMLDWWPARRPKPCSRHADLFSPFQTCGQTKSPRTSYDHGVARLADVEALSLQFDATHLRGAQAVQHGHSRVKTERHLLSLVCSASQQNATIAALHPQGQNAERWSRVGLKVIRLGLTRLRHYATENIRSEPRLQTACGLCTVCAFCAFCGLTFYILDRINP